MQKASKLQPQKEWIKVLGKGLITIPKAWREDFGVKPGDVLQAVKKTDRIVIEPKDKPAPYRVYSKGELKRFLQEDESS